MLLLLAGTREARDIAQGLAAQNTPAIASLAGATRDPVPLAITTRTGGFGGAGGFGEFLERAGITAILDATHPFASQISARSFEVARVHKIPYLQVLRPPWSPQKDDRWTMVASGEQAADYIAPDSTVFLATGRQSLGRFENLSKCRLICRQIDPPDTRFPFENGEFLIGRPPFSVTDEVALFKQLAVDWLIVKNAGGCTSRTKLDAARQLGIPVIMLDRPPKIGAPVVENVKDALSWFRGLA